MSARSEKKSVQSVKLELLGEVQFSNLVLLLH